MAPITDDDRPTGDPASPVPPEPGHPPFEALIPRLDRVSRASFRAGTLSRRRIVRAALLLVAVSVVIAALVILSVLTSARS